MIPEEFLKIDKTFLSEILLEEPGFHIEGITNTDKEKTEEVEGEDEKKEEKLSQEDENLLKEFEETTNDGKKSFDVFSFIKDDQIKNQVVIKKKDEDKDDLVLTPYTTDVEYLEDRFLLLATKMRMRNVEIETKDEDSYRRTDRNPETILRELRAKERMLTGKCEKRLKMTQEQTKWEPRLEKLGRIRNLTEFEKIILVALVGGIISNEISLVRKYTSDFTVGSLLSILCNSLQERVHNRKVFYRTSVLVSDGFIRVSDKLSEDLMNCQVDIDRRMLDYFVGLDCEFGEIVEGSNLYFPKVKLENVVIPEPTKKLILSTVSNYEEFKKYRKKFGFEDIVSYGKGIVLLFHGESGTGKTFLANAIANHLQKKILLINFGSLGDKIGDILKFIFREAKINDALLFFDECESFFETRDKFGSNIQPFLTELERHDGLIILATNRPYDLDEAMHRRITLAIEFKTPDPFLRESIWKKHLPETFHSKDIDFEKLALNYELTGGLIKNAVLTSLSIAVSRDTQNPVITLDDLEKGAKLQLRGEFSQKSFEKKVTPSRSLDELVLDEKLKTTIQEIVSFEKSRRILYTQWGFNEKMSQRHGTSILVFGPSGTGKTSVLEGIGFELGLPLKVVDMVEVLTKYSFSTSQNIQNIFKETKKLGAILVFEIQQSGFFRIEESIQLLLSNIEHYDGIVALNITVDNVHTMMDRSIFMKFKFNIEFTKPSPKLRLLLWKKMIPPKTPVKDIDFEKLSSFDLTGGEIYDIIFKTASKVSLRKEKMIHMKDIIEHVEEVLRSRSSEGIESMFY